MVEAEVKPTTRRPYTEDEWGQIGEEFANGVSIPKLAEKYNVSTSTLVNRSKRGQWMKRRECKRLGVEFDPFRHEEKIHVDEEVEVARSLKREFDRKYYSELRNLQKKLDHIDTLFFTASSGMELDYLTKAADRILERMRVILLKPTPGKMQDSKRVQKLISGPAEPIDA